MVANPFRMRLRTALPASLTLIVAGVLALAPQAHAARSVDGAIAPPGARSVGSAAGFEAAVAAMRDTGGTITLTAGTYSTKMRIGPRSSRRLTISGPARGRAVVRAIVLDRAQAVTIRKLHIRAMARDGGIHTIYSRHIRLHDLTFTAIGTTRRVGVNLDHSSHVTVDHSVFAHCGDNTPRWSMCILPRYAAFVTIEHSRFHDCLGCDFIHGRAGPKLRIQSNTFNRALACHHSWHKCGHQDMVELFLANGMVVRDNIFGVNQFGGAQLYMALAVDHVRVLDNLFLASDPRAPGVVPRTGILVGTKAALRVPHDVDIINNTILSGSRRPDHNALSIVVSHRYNVLKRAWQPLIANNILGKQLSPNLVCPRLRRSTHNVITKGVACGSTDVVGDPLLNTRERPTAASVLVIDKANPLYAPVFDLLGHRRRGPPDIGAYEYHGR
jgi:parallel beta helix pectate lyase-like protein